MERVLLVEDSKDCQILVNRALNSMVQLFVASSIHEAMRMLDSDNYSVLLLDVNLPDGNGFSLCTKLLADKGIRRPRIIFLTGSQEIADKLTGFSVGGDDFINKPFDHRELKARVKAQLRSKNEALGMTQTIEVGNILLNLPDYSVEVKGDLKNFQLNLTPTEFKLLYALVKNQGRILSRERLMDALSENREHITDRTIDAHLCKIRKKLELATHEIEAVYGIGYRLVAKCS